MTKAISLLSGGMDSATTLYWMQKMYDEVIALSINYHQRHLVELKAAARIAKAAGVEHVVIDLSGITPAFAGSALTTDSVKVPHGHYTDESMKVTVVPNRNMVFLAIAGALAVSRGAEAIGFGAHNGDAAIYPDCRPAFTKAFNQTLELATEGYGVPGLRVSSPFINNTKADIVQIGVDLGVPLELTWSCYEGWGDYHCGECGTCVERREAFRLAEVPDPTIYIDQTQVRRGPWGYAQGELDL